MTTDNLRRLLLCLASALVIMAAGAEEADSTKRWSRYIPTVNGTLRTFFEQSTVTGQSRFMVQNARISAGGYVLPWLDYYLQVDFCAKGKVRILDVYAAIVPVDGLRIMIGQSKAPFSTLTARSPHNYYFANTPFTFTPANVRSAGVRATYAVPRTPLHIEAGCYNGTDMTDHNAWNKSMLYSARLWAAVAGFTPSLGFMSREPVGNGNGVRVSMFDAMLSFASGRFYAEAEYLLRHYRHGAHKASHIYSVMADYYIPLKARMADRLSFQARFDGITDYSDAIKYEGAIKTTEGAHKRITFGVTTTKSVGKVRCSFLVNFEQYFYPSDAAAPAHTPSADNRLTAGLNLRF